MKRRLIILVCALAAIALVYRVFIYKSDPDRVRARIAEIAKAGSYSEGTNPAIYALQVKSALREAFAQGATVSSDELGGASLGVDDVTAGAARLAAIHRSATLVIADLQVVVEGTGAQASGHVILTANDGGASIRLADRMAHFELTKTSGDWKITRIVVDP